MWVIRVFAGDRSKPIPVTTLAISSRRASACAFVPGRPKVRGPRRPVVAPG
jgi:hypothetical protein